MKNANGTFAMLYTYNGNDRAVSLTSTDLKSAKKESKKVFGTLRKDNLQYWISATLENEWSGIICEEHPVY